MEYVTPLQRFIGKQVWVNLDSTVFSITIREIKRLAITSCPIKPEKVSVGTAYRSPTVMGIVGDEGTIGMVPPDSVTVLLDTVVYTYPTYTVVFSEKPIEKTDDDRSRYKG